MSDNDLKDSSKDGNETSRKRADVSPCHSGHPFYRLPSGSNMSDDIKASSKDGNGNSRKRADVPEVDNGCNERGGYASMTTPKVTKGIGVPFVDSNGQAQRVGTVPVKRKAAPKKPIRKSEDPGTKTISTGNSRNQNNGQDFLPGGSFRMHARNINFNFQCVNDGNISADKDENKKTQKTNQRVGTGRKRAKRRRKR